MTGIEDLNFFLYLGKAAVYIIRSFFSWQSEVVLVPGIISGTVGA